MYHSSSLGRKNAGTKFFLPSEDEWYKAAYYDPDRPGASYWDYPTRHDDPDVPDGIDSAGDADFDAVFYDGHYQGGPNTIDDTGTPSAYGTMGQGGNVWEWTDRGTEYREIRGGAWDRHHLYLYAEVSGYGNPAYEGYDIGFRVASY